jgi:hypothetical protein
MKTMNTNPVFDIPNLVGKNISEVKAVLGEPFTGGTVVDEPATSPTGESMMVWIKGEYGLMANFRQATGGITNFLLTPKNPQPGNPYSFRDDQRQDFLRGCYALL